MRKRPGLVIVATAIVVLVVAINLRLFVWPTSSAVPAKADAVAVLSGGSSADWQGNPGGDTSSS